jgi:alpha-glucosidase (family GH31 glycosyl hydrolase)
MKFADNQKLTFVNCSPGFIRAFKTWNPFSWRRHHFKRRPAASQEVPSRWRVSLSSLLKTFRNNDIQFILIITPYISSSGALVEQGKDQC